MHILWGSCRKLAKSLFFSPQFAFYVSIFIFHAFRCTRPLFQFVSWLRQCSSFLQPVHSFLPGDHPHPLEGNGPVFGVLPSNRQNKMWWMWGEIGKQFIKPRTHIATCNYSWHWLVLRLIIATVWCDFHILTETFSYLRKIPFHELSLAADCIFCILFMYYNRKAVTVWIFFMHERLQILE